MEFYPPEGWEKGQCLPGEEFVLHGVGGTAAFTESWHPPRTPESEAAARVRAREVMGGPL